MRVLVTGCDGQVGHELLRQAAGFSIDVTGMGRQQLDITDVTAVDACLDQIRPAVVINAAAYTAVDLAESEPDLAMKVNRDGPANLARACARHDSPILHISTDYVFDGTKGGAYSEEDAVAPLGVYGESKWAGEQAVRVNCHYHIILRTSWVFSAHGNNFVTTMLQLGREREELGVVADQIGCPTSAQEIARTLYRILQVNMQSKGNWGTYHFCQGTVTSWHGFATAIFSETQVQGEALRIKTVRPITTEEYPTAATRPANSALDCQKIINDFGIQIRPWHHSLAEVIGELRSE